WIYRMNYFLSYIQEHETALTEEGKTRLMGEVHFLRAWSYFLLIQRYAGVPLITKPHSLDDDFVVTRANFDDCVDFILGELDISISATTSSTRP
ncbi:MAG: RagB/SusD family nutrient uptake outer membrane protein, partial [Clostridia bacterium]|nr:RagB/SusD family nutrient uptake outer membrane protein [Clostridia bacterium]